MLKSLMHQHTSISWYFITKPLLAFPYISFFASEYHACVLHSVSRAFNARTYFGHFHFLQQKSFGDLALATDPTFMWIPAAAGATVAQDTGVDIFDWSREDYDADILSQAQFPWHKIQESLLNTFFWDCNCPGCTTFLPDDSPDPEIANPSFLSIPTIITPSSIEDKPLLPLPKPTPPPDCNQCTDLDIYPFLAELDDLLNCPEE